MEMFRPCSLREVKRIVPFSSPIINLAVFVFRACAPLKVEFRGFLLRTVLALTAFTTRVWPFVHDFKASTLTNTGFRSHDFFAEASPFCCLVDVGGGGIWLPSPEIERSRVQERKLTLIGRNAMMNLQ
ncbi:hypothetical protein CASFOL_018227 [Castilleja foliolosa]|uniref:Uncharacterized protein n=1 Tax=Castilleja foliolosa TaxID=1961234 RepID=A0ABD3D9D7_9LAMI